MNFFLATIGIYLGIVNIWGFVFMWMDKRRAERNIWRISEFSLFIPAFFGGVLGCILGMRLFHHKTRHPKFVIGMPIILIIQVALACWLIFLSPWSISFM